MRVVLCIAAMEAGGAERVVAHMAEHWAGVGHEVHVVTLAAPGAESFYPLHHAVRLHNLGLSGASSGMLCGIWNNLRRVVALRKTIRALDPDIVISHVDAMNALVALAVIGTGPPHIATEHIHPPAHAIGRVWAGLRWLSYGLADRIVVLTEATRRWMPDGVRDKTVVIPNPIPAAREVCDSLRVHRFERTVLGVGRLVPQKGFDRLITAFAQARKGHAGWGLVILGEGAHRASLARLVSEAGLDGSVELPGIVDDPFGRYAADIFCLPSRYEGFPMALCEAMAAGVPPVAFDCPTGPRELIRDGGNGILVAEGDVQALADALGRMMADADLRETMGRAAVEGIRRFAPEIIMARWDQLFEEVV